MEKIKRTFMVVLSVIMVLSLFSACGKQEVKWESYYDEDDISHIDVPGDSANSSGSSSSGTKKVTKKKTTNVTSSEIEEAKKATGGRFDNLDYSKLKGKDAIKLLVWYTPEEFEQKIYDQFSEITGAEIKYVQVGTSTNKLAALIAANDAPDAAMMEDKDFPSYITKKLVQPLDSYIDKSKDTWLAYNIMDDIKYDGKYFGITDPFWGDTFFVYFNKDLFDNELSVEKNPLDLYKEGNWTWDTFYDLASKMTKKDSKGSIIQYGSIHTHLNLFALSAGASVVTPNGGKFTNTLNSQQMKDAAEMEKKLSAGGYYVVDQGDFAKGNVAMVVYPQYPIRNKMKSWSSYTFKWDVVPFPKYPNGPSYNPAGYQFGVVPNKAKHPEAGYMLLNYRAYCQANMTTLTNTTEEWKKLYRETALGKTKAPLDVGVVGTSMWNLYRELADSSQKTQTTIDSWLPRIDGKIREFEEEVKAYQ